MISDLPSLLSRVEAASGADRKLDDAILAALFPKEWARSRSPNGCADDRFLFIVGSDDEWHAARFTANVHLVIGLVERMLPGWDIKMRRGLRGEYAMAEICQRTGAFRDETLGFNERADNELPLAIIAALLVALERKDNDQ